MNFSAMLNLQFTINSLWKHRQMKSYLRRVDSRGIDPTKIFSLIVNNTAEDGSQNMSVVHAVLSSGSNEIIDHRGLQFDNLITRSATAVHSVDCFQLIVLDSSY